MTNNCYPEQVKKAATSKRKAEAEAEEKKQTVRRSGRSKEEQEVVELGGNDEPTAKWRKRGESSTGSRLSSVKSDPKLAFDLAVKELRRAVGECVQHQARMAAKQAHDSMVCMFVVGRKVQVAGNGYCWLISFLVTFGVIEKPSTLTPQDVRVINMLVEHMQTFFEAEAAAKRKWTKQFNTEQSETVRRLPQLRAGASGAEVLTR